MGSQLMKKTQVDQQIVPDIPRIELAGTMHLGKSHYAPYYCCRRRSLNAFFDARDSGSR